MPALCEPTIQAHDQLIFSPARAEHQKPDGCAPSSHEPLHPCPCTFPGTITVQYMARHGGSAEPLAREKVAGPGFDHVSRPRSHGMSLALSAHRAWARQAEGLLFVSAQPCSAVCVACRCQFAQACLLTCKRIPGVDFVGPWPRPDAASCALRCACDPCVVAAHRTLAHAHACSALHHRRLPRQRPAPGRQ